MDTTPLLSPRAFISGATAGISAGFGAEFARQLAASGADRVTVLVNDAGFGLLKPFDDNPVDDEQQLLDLLVTAPMRLAHSALGQMLGSGCGTIVNITSVVGYTPGGT